MNLKKFYKKNQTKLIIGLVIFIIICIIIELVIIKQEKITDQDLVFESIGWSEYCDGRNYSISEKQEFCEKCSDNGGADCDWPLDMNFKISKVKQTQMTGGEIHCLMIIDGINYYKEMGSYYGIQNESLFTWQVIDASKRHEVQFCCGIERETVLSKFINVKNKWPTACVKEEVQPRCN